MAGTAPTNFQMTRTLHAVPVHCNVSLARDQVRVHRLPPKLQQERQVFFHGWPKADSSV
jgi:hypothetical protein